VKGKVSADAIAELQNRGFRTRTQQKPDSNVPPDHVISTDPAANSSVGAGDEITLIVSTGPEQREIPDVRNLSYDDAVEKLKDAGFENFRPSSSPSTPEMKDKVLGTNPPVNQTSAITNSITIVLGAGPETRAVPDVKEQSQDSAVQILTASGFTKTVPVQVDSTLPVGQLIGTNPPAGETVPVDTVIQLQVSRGNQFIMPDLRGQFWTDAEPRLRALGWTGVLDRGADVRDSGQRANAVVTQSPSAGTGVNYDSRITLSFAS
jgi:serine/threonine-protein kinase